MSKFASRFEGNTFLICCSVAVAILFIDLNIPLGVAGGVLYILVILLSLNATQLRATFILAIICTVFVVIGYLNSPKGGILWQVIANRMLAILAIWVTAILAMQRLQKERQLAQQQLNALHATQAVQLKEEKIKFLRTVMRTVLDIFDNFLNNLQLVKIKVEKHEKLTTEEIEQFDKMILDTAAQLKRLANLESIKEKEIAGGMMGINYESDDRPILKSVHQPFSDQTRIM